MHIETNTLMTPKQAIEKAAAYLKGLPFDKKLHYAAGLLIAGVLTNFLPSLLPWLLPSQ